MGSDSQINEDQTIIFFDGVCNLCNGAVNVILEVDKKKQFFFASLQSNFSQTFLSERYPDAKSVDSIILATPKEIFVKSRAALKIAERLGGFWRIFTVFSLLPRAWADSIYDWIAKNRYSWFGKRETCRMPTPELKARFLDSEDVA